MASNTLEETGREKMRKPEDRERILKAREDFRETIWLGENVMAWKRYRYMQPAASGHFNWIDDAGGVVAEDTTWTPLESLDDCRYLEDRLRELGLEKLYIGTLDQKVLFPKYGPQKVAGERIKFATAREICQAVRRTWLQRKEREGTK